MSSRTEATWVSAFLALQLTGCSAKKSPYDLSLKKGDHGKHLSMDEVSGYAGGDDEPRPTKKKTKGGAKRRPKGTPAPSEGAAPLSPGNVVNIAPVNTAGVGTGSGSAAAANAATLDANALTTTSPQLLAGCQELVTRYVAPYKKLFALVPTGAYQPDGSSLDKLLAVTAADCDAKATRRAAALAVVAGVNQHSGKIGVILPLTGPRAKFANYIVHGLRAALAENNQKMEDVVVLKDSVGQAKTAEARLSELIFHDKVTLVIGGMDAAEADLLAKWSKDLMVPVMLLARDREVTAASPFAFRVYPDEKRLAETLVNAAVKRGLKRIAIVRPDNHKSDKIADYFRKALAKAGGNVAFDLVFTPGNLDSMMGVGRQMFQIDAADRRDEFQRAYKKARKAAADENVPFDPRMVVLKPIVQFDAVFLPDDFRTVRHFAKLFKFNMVDKLPMIGNHEWRSPALVEPWDPFLEGSIFADFIGSYAKLPTGLATETVGSPYFVRPQQVVITDFQLIGYRAGKAARITAAQAAGKNRRQLNLVAGALVSDQPNFFGTGKVFDEERQSNWPTFLFSVAKDRIILESEGNVAGVALAPGAPAKY